MMAEMEQGGSSHLLRKTDASELLFESLTYMNWAE